MDNRFSVEPGTPPPCDAYQEVFHEVQHRLRTMAPTGKMFVELKHFARSKAREITDSSETLQDDLRICHQAIIDGARAYLLQAPRD